MQEEAPRSAEKTADTPTIVRKRPFSSDYILRHTDPGPAAETEEFVRLIYEDRRESIEKPRSK